MENKNSVKLLLRSEEVYSDNERESEIEVLSKKELKSIIDNLDINEIAHEAYGTARSYTMSGYIEVDVDARDGEVLISFSRSNHTTIGYYDAYINLFNIETGDGIGDEYKYPEYEIYLFTEDEHIDYFEELKERNARIKDNEEDGEILNETEIRDAVIEKFNLDLDDLLDEYYSIIDAELVEYNQADVDKQIEELYSHQI